MMNAKDTDDDVQAPQNWRQRTQHWVSSTHLEAPPNIFGNLPTNLCLDLISKLVKAITGFAQLQKTSLKQDAENDQKSVTYGPLESPKIEKAIA